MKTFEITQEQIKELSKVSLNADEVFRKWFPEAFEKTFEVGKWYKIPNMKFLICITNVEKNQAYGFDIYGEYLEETTFGLDGFVEATDEEVETALIADAKKRYSTNIVKSLYGGTSYKEKLGNFFEYYADTNRLWSNGIKLFDNGKWAEIIETITLEEAEKLLNKKIV